MPINGNISVITEKLANIPHHSSSFCMATQAKKTKTAITNALYNILGDPDMNLNTQHL